MTCGAATQCVTRAYLCPRTTHAICSSYGIAQAFFNRIYWHGLSQHGEFVAGSSEVYFEQLDISDESSVKAFAKRVKDNYKNVAILVNNAGKMLRLSSSVTRECTSSEIVEAILRLTKRSLELLRTFRAQYIST